MRSTPFKESHPNYAGYTSKAYEVNSIPQPIISGLLGLIPRHGDSRSNVDRFRSHIPEGPTRNWGSPWLDDDLAQALHDLARKPLHKFMDAIAEWASLNTDSTLLSELDELFIENQFGYELVKHFQRVEWQLRDDSAAATVTALESAQTTVMDVCQESLRHLQEASAAVEREGDRARKNAVRDAMSAMESLYKVLTGKNDIADAWKALRDGGTWGPSEIVKDGFSVWNQLHYLYPDIRHGQAAGTDLTREEAHYWIERICAVVRYLGVKRSGK